MTITKAQIRRALTVQSPLPSCFADTFGYRCAMLRGNAWLFKTQTQPVVQNLSPLHLSKDNDQSTLLTIRFDRNINFQFIIAETSKQLMLPPLALQLVIENAIKHNEVSSELPLNVIIVSNEDSIEVKNNLQLRSNVEETTKTGLNNIRQRYKFYTNRSVEIIQDENNFTVKMPLLQKI